MSRTNTYSPAQGCRRANIYPIQDFLEVQRLMTKLDLTPADALSVLKDALIAFEDADRQSEDAEGLDVPWWHVSSTP